MGVLLVVLFPILLLGSSGALGFWNWTFFAGLFFSDQSKRGDDDWLKGIALASSIPVVAAAAVLAGRSSEFASSFGESFMEFLWLWCACAFVVGLLFGWRFSRSAANVPLRFFSGVAIDTASRVHDNGGPRNHSEGSSSTPCNGFEIFFAKKNEDVDQLDHCGVPATRVHSQTDEQRRSTLVLPQRQD